MPLRIETHRDHFAGQQCKGIRELSEPFPQQTEKISIKFQFFIDSFTHSLNFAKLIDKKWRQTSVCWFPYAAASVTNEDNNNQNEKHKLIFQLDIYTNRWSAWEMKREEIIENNKNKKQPARTDSREVGSEELEIESSAVVIVVDCASALSVWPILLIPEPFLFLLCDQYSNIKTQYFFLIHHFLQKYISLPELPELKT